MEEGRQLNRTPYAKIMIAAGVLMLVGLPLPWLSTGIGEGARTYSGLVFPAVWITTVLCAIASTVLALAWWRSKSDRFAQYAGLAAGFLLLFLVAMLGVIEAFGDLLPTSLLPASLRRSSGVLAGGIGLWTTLAGAACVVAAAGGEVVWELGLRAWRSPRGPEKLAAAALLGLLALLVGWLRYQPLLTASAFGEGFTLSAQAAPFVGPASLIAILLLVGAVVLTVLSLSEPAGLLAAGAGWLLTLIAAVGVIGSEALGALRIGDLVGGHATGHSVTFHPAVAAWLTYLVGLLIALVGSFLIGWRYQSGDS